MPPAEPVVALFDDVIHVHYGFVWVAASYPEADEAFSGQCNGLAGAAIAGTLFLRVALHTGPISLRVESLEAAPQVDDVWDDVVEVSFDAPSEATLGAFEEFHDLRPWPPAPRCRVRFSGLGMDAAREAESLAHDAAPIDRYLLQLWPDAEQRADAIIRQTSQIATYWHGTTG